MRTILRALVGLASESIAAAALVFAVVACSDRNAGNNASTKVDNNWPANTPASQSQVPPANYEEKEGDTYFYVTAVSEEDRKTGKSAGNVVAFKYLGEKDGLYRLELVDDDGSRIGVSECPRQCKVIKSTWRDGSVKHVGFNPESVVGSAFEDAFNGHLKRAKSEPPLSKKESPTVIPAAFLGEWNADKAACGTGLSDTRLRIEPKRLRFYESDGAVKRVTVHDDRSATVEASFSGEGQRWNDAVEMVLSRSGDELTIGDLTRSRCPL
jgi:hypothetical protein